MPPSGVLITRFFLFLKYIFHKLSQRIRPASGTASKLESSRLFLGATTHLETPVVLAPSSCAAMPAIWHCNHDRSDAVAPFYRAERAHRVRELNYYYYDDCHCRRWTRMWCRCQCLHRDCCCCSSTVALRLRRNCSRQLWRSHVMNSIAVSRWSSYWYTKCAQYAAANAVPEIHRRAGVPNAGNDYLNWFLDWAGDSGDSPHCCCCCSV